MGNVLPNPLPNLQRRQLDGRTPLFYPLRIIQRDIGHEELLSIVRLTKKPVMDIVVQFGIVEKVVVAHVDLFATPSKGKTETVFAYIQSHPGCRSTEITSETSISQSTVERCLAELRKQGRVEYEGSKKSGGYRAV